MSRSVRVAGLGESGQGVVRGRAARRRVGGFVEVRGGGFDLLAQLGVVGLGGLFPQARGRRPVDPLGLGLGRGDLLLITGLQGGTSHVSHIHIGSCQKPGGIKFALNQVIADSTGVADAKTQVPGTFPPTGSKWYVVVHQGADMQGSNATYLMCGNLF